MPPQHHISLPPAVILAGGLSRRFGSNKLAAKVDGVAILERVIRVTREAASEVYISIGSGDTSADLIHESGCATIRDEIPGIGPIGGLFSAMRRLESEWILLVAGDMPHLTSGCLLELIAETTDHDVDAVIARDGRGRIHPLAACYRSSVLPHIERCLDSDEFAMKTLISTLKKVRYVIFRGETLRNVNRHEDLNAESFK